MTPKTFIQVFIKSEADLPKEEGRYFVNIRHLDEGDTKRLYRFAKTPLTIDEWLEDIDWYLQPLPDKSKTAEAIEDFITSKIAKTLNPKGWEVIMSAYPTMVLELEDWFDEFAAQSQPVSMPTDEEIEHWADDMTEELQERSLPSEKIRIIKRNRIFGAKAMRDGKIKSQR